MLAVVVKSKPTGLRKVAIDRAQLGAFVVGEREVHVEAVTLHRAKSFGRAQALFFGTGAGMRNPDGYITFGRIASRDEVDNTGDCIGTVQSGGTVGQYFNPLD